MRSSTHGGFRLPPICSLSGRLFRSMVACLALPDFQSRAVGVANISWFTAWLNGVPPCLYFAFLIPVSSATGVGHIITTIARFCCLLFGPLCFQSLAIGVGQNPDAFPLVRCSGMDCSQHTPPRIVPHRGQVPENSPQSPGNKHWGIFHEDEARSHFANDTRHFSLESGPCAVDSGAFSGCTDVLAGKAPSDDVDVSSPWLAVECGDVVPDGEGVKDAVSLSGEEDSPGIGIDFNSASGAPSKEEPSQDASSSPCK